MSGKDAKSFNNPIHEISTELAQKASDACNELINIKDIKPMSRATVPKGHEVKYLVVSKDGSASAHSSTLHVTSVDEAGNTNVKIAKSATKVRLASAPSKESYGYILALEILQSYLEATYHMFADKFEEYNAYIIGDSQTSLMALKGNTTDTALRAVFGKMQDLGVSLYNRFPKLRIKFIWLPAALNPADFNSKLHNNLNDIVNADIWRFGPKQFADQEFLEDQTVGIIF